MTPAWVLGSPARIIAFGLGSGLIRPAPGTWGTLAGWLAYVWLVQPLPDWQRLALVVAAGVVGVWACARAGRDLGVADHGGIVWDEIVAIWLVLVLVPPSLGAQAAAFVLFRFFDIVKPPPIRHVDARWKNGFGVMLDDLLAAGYTLLAFSLWIRLTQ
ncbi:MAG: phosphatidylglycerophosphatase A [Burkholderiales bacterium]|nr:phosphatidylglycerophosphatase A [Burkholderiales bacterium]